MSHVLQNPALMVIWQLGETRGRFGIAQTAPGYKIQAMSSAVRSLQRAVTESKEPLASLLRQAKVIAASLKLDDVEQWVDLELKGYPADTQVPVYRNFTSSHVEIRNPMRSWEFAGHFQHTFPAHEPVAEIEDLAAGEGSCFTLRKQLPVSGNSIGRDYAQRVHVPASQFKKVAEAIRNELLQWTVELIRRGIKGEEMDFTEQEQRDATTQTFHIQKFTGVLGNVSGSVVTLYDYSTLHQTLKEHQVPQSERNDLENIMDELKQAEPAQRQTLLERGKAWVVKNKDFLGASADIVRKALGNPF